MAGLCLYLNCSRHYFAAFETNNKDSEEFIIVIDAIKETIRAQQVSGAAAGVFHHNIIARLQGMTDKQETKHTGSLSIQEAQIILPPNGE